MTTRHAELFVRCGKAFCGDGPRWKEQFAAMLGIKPNTVDKLAKGTSPIPPDLWLNIAGLIQDRENGEARAALARLKMAVLHVANPEPTL
jgi:hypothetical protein